MNSSAFSSAWLTRMFVDAVPFSIALRIFDVYMHQGCEVHWRIGISLLKAAKDVLVVCKSPSMFLSTLSDFTKAFKMPAKIFEKAWKLKLKSSLSSYAKQRHRASSSSKTQVKGVVASSSSSGEPKKRELTTSSSKLRNFFPTLNFKSRIMSDTDWNYIYNWMPMRYTIRDPILLHSMDQEGTSLPLIYKTLGNHEPSLVVVKTKQERVRQVCHWSK